MLLWCVRSTYLPALIFMYNTSISCCLIYRFVFHPITLELSRCPILKMVPPTETNLIVANSATRAWRLVTATYLFIRSPKHANGTIIYGQPGCVQQSKCSNYFSHHLHYERESLSNVSSDFTTRSPLVRILFFRLFVLWASVDLYQRVVADAHHIYTQ